MAKDEHGCPRDQFNRTNIIACIIHQMDTPEMCPKGCEFRKC